MRTAKKKKKKKKKKKNMQLMWAFFTYAKIWFSYDTDDLCSCIVLSYRFLNVIKRKKRKKKKKKKKKKKRRRGIVLPI